MSTVPYTVLVGVGTLYIGAANLARPATVETTPGAGWTSLGETDGGVTIRKTQNIERFSSDQRTGNIKAVRTEEGLEIETNLNEATLENLAYAIEGTVTDTPAGVGTIGTRALKLYKGADVGTFALLFRGSSPYGAFAGEFYVPVVFSAEDVEMEFAKDGKTLIPVKFEALEDTTAGSATDRFGSVIYKDAVAS